MIPCQWLQKTRCPANQIIKTCRRRDYSSWASHVSEGNNTVQAYISSSRDPYINLSIEHVLLQRSPKDSKLLFLYVNKPCVVIGRNQNPWLETNLNVLANAHRKYQNSSNYAQNHDGQDIGKVDLVRRRSGGGTVFHDEGNVNWTVISPSADFTRDKHAEMVVRALRENGVERARVNERHDIVIDQGTESRAVAPSDYHVTPYTAELHTEGATLKASGSAFKLTRGRALHHGTCLLRSANLKSISNYLHSPAKPYIQAKGVDSVRSPVTTIDIENKDFQDAVLQAFKKMYAPHGGPEILKIGEDEALDQTEVQKGVAELHSPAWAFRQTPVFKFSGSPSLGAGTSPLISLEFRNCEIVDCNINVTGDDSAKNQEIGSALRGRVLYEDWDWRDALTGGARTGESEALGKLCTWLDQVLPTGRNLPANLTGFEQVGR